MNSGKRIVLASGVVAARRLTHDVSFKYRMGAGFPGDVNRMHPASIEPCLIDPTAPPLYYGQAVVVDTASGGVRPLVAGDSALTEVYGITVRPYPFQQTSVQGLSQPFGSAIPPTRGTIDVLRSGYIMVPIYGTTTKGGLVYIWYAASAANHIQGLFEGANTAGSTLQLTGNNNTTFNGAPDNSAMINANVNVTELIFNA